MGFDRNLAEGNVLIGNQFGPSLGHVCRWQETLIEDKFWDLVADWIVGLSLDFWHVNV